MSGYALRANPTYPDLPRPAPACPANAVLQHGNYFLQIRLFVKRSPLKSSTRKYSEYNFFNEQTRRL